MHKKLIIFSFLFFVCTHSANSQKNYVYKVDSAKAAWFSDAKFGIFVHLGLYSILGGTYNGISMPYLGKDHPNGNSWYAEWIEQRLDVPDSAYHKLVSQFDLKKFNADQWISEIKNAGAKYFVITAKHHDGFALWDSKYGDYDIGNSPLKGRDILGELVAACKKYGIKYGFYYSHWQDWNDVNGAKPNWKPNPTSEQFEKYWKGKCLPQITELVKKYDPDILWLDTWGDANVKIHITAQRRDELIATVRKLSDHCLINGRIALYNPSDNVDIIEMLDNEYPDKLLTKAWQTPATMQHTWGYHSKDYNWKSANSMLRLLVQNVSMGGNYLVNIGPAPDGTFPVPASQRLMEMGAWILGNAASIYGTTTSAIAVPKGIVTAKKLINGRSNIFVYILDTNMRGDVSIGIDASKIKTVEALDLHSPLKYSQNSNDSQQSIIHIQDLPQYDCSVRVIRIELKG